MLSIVKSCYLIKAEDFCSALVDYDETLGMEDVENFLFANMENSCEKFNLDSLKILYCERREHKDESSQNRVDMRVINVIMALIINGELPNEFFIVDERG